MCGRQSRPPVFRHSRIPTLLWERKRAADAFTRWCRGNIFKRHALDLPSSRILLMTFPRMRGKTLSPRRPGVGQKRCAATWRPPWQAPGKGRSGFPRRNGRRKEGRREGRKESPVGRWLPGAPVGLLASPVGVMSLPPPPPFCRLHPPSATAPLGTAAAQDQLRADLPREGFAMHHPDPCAGCESMWKELSAEQNFFHLLPRLCLIPGDKKASALWK